jgi:hypothetical protein
LSRSQSRTALGELRASPCAHVLAQGAPGHFQHGLQLGVLGRPHAGKGAERGLFRGEQAGQAAEMVQQIPGQIHRAFSGDAHA